MKELETLEQIKAVNEQEGLVVFLFTTTWCPDCHYIKPFMPEVEKKFSQMSFYTIDRDKRMDVAQAFGIMGIPSFVVLKKGKVISTFISSLRKTQAEIEAFLQDALTKEA